MSKTAAGLSRLAEMAKAAEAHERAWREALAAAKQGVPGAAEAALHHMRAMLAATP